MYKRNKIPMQAVIRNGIVMYEPTDEYRRQMIDNYLAEKPVIFEGGDTLFEGGGEKDFLVDENTGVPQWLLNEAENGIQQEPDNFDFMTRPLTYKRRRTPNKFEEGGDKSRYKNLIYNPTDRWNYKQNDIGEVLYPSFQEWANGNKYNDIAPDWMFRDGYQGPRTYGAVYDNFASQIQQYNTERRLADRQEILRPGP